MENEPNSINNYEYKSQWQEGLHLSNSYVEILEKTTHYYEAIISMLTSTKEILNLSSNEYLNPLEYNFNDYEADVKLDLSDIDTAIKNIIEQIGDSDGMGGLIEEVANKYIRYSARIDVLIEKIDQMIRESYKELINPNGEIDWVTFWANHTIQDEVMKKIYDGNNIEEFFDYLDKDVDAKLSKYLVDQGFDEDEIRKYREKNKLGSLLIKVFQPIIHNALTSGTKKGIEAFSRYIQNTKQFEVLMGEFKGGIMGAALRDFTIGMVSEMTINLLMEHELNIQSSLLEVGAGMAANAIRDKIFAAIGLTAAESPLGSAILSVAIAWGIKKGVKAAYYSITHTDGIPNEFEPFDIEEYIKDNKTPEEVITIDGHPVGFYDYTIYCPSLGKDKNYEMSINMAIPVLMSIGYTDKEAIFEVYYQTQGNEVVKDKIINTYEEENIDLDLLAYVISRNDFELINFYNTEEEYENYLSSYCFLSPGDIEKVAPLVKEYTENAKKRLEMDSFDFYGNCQDGDTVRDIKVYVADTTETISNATENSIGEEFVFVIPQETSNQWNEELFLPESLSEMFEANNGNTYLYCEPNNTSDGGVFHPINEFGGFIGDDTFSLNDLNITIDN